jgi:hypothetical protein
MTSWIRVSPPLKKKEEELKPLFLSTTDEEIPTQLLNFFYSYLYARDSVKVPLAVYDRNNPVSTNFGMFQATLYDMSGVEYVDTLIRNGIPIARRYPQIVSYIQSLKKEVLADEAQVFFEFNDSAGQQIREFLKLNGFPREFDVAVVYHPTDSIGLGTRKGVSISNLVTSLRSFQARAGLTSLSVFVASSDSSLQYELKKQGDASWKLYSLPPTRIQTAVGISPSVRMRQEAFIQTLAELVVLQNAPAVIGKLNTSIGRFLYLTRTEPSSFLAIDGAEGFTPF